MRSLADAVSDARTVLVFGPASTDERDDRDRRSWSLTSNKSNVLAITNSLTGDGWDRERTAEFDPSSPTAAMAMSDAFTAERSIELSGTLVEIGTRTRERLREQSESRDQPVVYFDSLTALLRQIGPRTAFRFMHALCEGVEETDAIMYAWMDPDAHDESTWRTFAYLFEAVIEPDRTGEWNRLETRVRVE